VATAYVVVGMGIATLFMLEQIQPGTVDAMLRSPIGQIALVTSAAVYAAGVWAIRRMTRVDV
jgi:tight adherence protein B